MEALHLAAPGRLQYWPADSLGREYRSQDLDDVRHHVGRMFCEHDMHMVDRRGCLDTRISQFECRAVTLVDMAYGADVMINPGRLDHFYLIQIPLSGGARVVMNGEEFECRPGMATVQDPDVPLQMYWGKGCRKLVLRFDRARFERFAELNHGKTFPRTIPMMPMLDLTQPEGLALSGLIQAVSTFPAAQTVVPAMITSHWELCLMSALFMMRAGSDASDHGPGVDFR